MLSRLIDIISGHYMESSYIYSPAWQLHETCAKLGIVTWLQVRVQKGMLAISWNGKRAQKMEQHSWIGQNIEWLHYVHPLMVDSESSKWWSLVDVCSYVKP